MAWATFGLLLNSFVACAHACRLSEGQERERRFVLVGAEQQGVILVTVGAEQQGVLLVTVEVA